MIPSEPGDARFDRFLPGTGLPRRRATLADAGLGGAGREVAEALFDVDLPRADALLRADRRMVERPIGRHHDLLVVAIATGESTAVELMLAHGAAPDGRVPGLPLELALRAFEPSLAVALLRGGASPSPVTRPVAPLRTAIAINSAGAVDLLLDAGAEVDAMEETGRRPLHIALDMERFVLSERLLARGADPWALDAGGANLGGAVTVAPLGSEPAELAARTRLQRRATALGWPDPAPPAIELRDAALAGAWPPAGSGAPPVPAAVLAIMAAAAVEPR